MAIYTVTTGLDEGARDRDLTLREAVALAAQNRGADTIVFARDVSLVQLDSGLQYFPNVYGDGPDGAPYRDVLVIDGDRNNDGIPDVTISGQDETYHVAVGSRGDLTLDGLRLIDGRGEGRDGTNDARFDFLRDGSSVAASIYNSGDLTLSGVVFAGNRATGGDGAGGREGSDGDAGDDGRTGSASDLLNPAGRGGHGDPGSDGGNATRGGDAGDGHLIQNTGTLTLRDTALERGNVMRGGDGGGGGTGGDGGKGGDGGTGGAASLGRSQGTGGDGADGGDAGNGGDAGAGGDANVIYSTSGATVRFATALGGPDFALFGGDPGSAGEAGARGARGEAGAGDPRGDAGSAGANGQDGATASAGAARLVSGRTTAPDTFDALILAAGPDGAVREGKAMKFSVARLGDTDGEVTVEYAVRLGNGLTKSDFKNPGALKGTLTFEDGEAVEGVRLRTKLDGLSERDEAVRFRITGIDAEEDADVGLGTRVARAEIDDIARVGGATGGRDVMVGSRADELFRAKSGNDVIRAKGGEDDLYGGRGKDVLNGGRGADDLWGNKGKDVYNGGGGTDVFHFRAGDGQDRIKGFQQGRDAIEFHSGVENFTDLEIAQRGDNVRIEHERGRIVVLDASAEEFTADDFLF